MVLEFSGNRFGSCDSLTRDINYSLSLSEGPQSDYNGIKLSYLFADSNPLKESRLKAHPSFTYSVADDSEGFRFFKTFRDNIANRLWATLGAAPRESATQFRISLASFSGMLKI